MEERFREQQDRIRIYTGRLADISSEELIRQKLWLERCINLEQFQMIRARRQISKIESELEKRKYPRF
jgi:hypothetical protein